MNSELIEKYLHGQCSTEELGQVLDWFRTAEAQAFLTREMELQRPRFMVISTDGKNVEIESEQLFARIQRYIKITYGGSRGFGLRWYLICL